MESYESLNYTLFRTFLLGPSLILVLKVTDVRRLSKKTTLELCCEFPLFCSDGFSQITSHMILVLTVKEKIRQYKHDKKKGDSIHFYV